MASSVFIGWIAGGVPVSGSGTSVVFGGTVVANGLTLDSTNQDVSLSRGAANRLDLATGDSLYLVSGGLGVGTAPPAAGSISATGTIDAANFKAAATGAIYWNSGPLFRPTADGKLVLSNNAESAGVGFDVTTDNLIKIRTRAQTSDACLSVGGGTTALAPLTIGNGTNLTNAAANAIENDGTAFYNTIDTTNGRRYDDSWNYFRLTGSGSGITTIADFFGNNDGIPLVANGVYQIHWHCKFSQATAGTATWTIVTATTALANLDAEYIGSNIAGIGAVGAPQHAGVTATASSSTALPVTGTEANAATHVFDITATVVAGNGASNTRLRLTMSAGTATPLTNSYFRVRRLAAGNVGAFVA